MCARGSSASLAFRARASRRSASRVAPYGARARAREPPPRSSPPAASGPAKPYDGTTVRGVNFLKAGEDPAILPDAQYPAWLWGLTDEGAGYLEMRKRFIDDPSKLSKDELSTYFMLRRRVEIKERNAELAK